MLDISGLCTFVRLFKKRMTARLAQEAGRIGAMALLLKICGKETEVKLFHFSLAFQKSSAGALPV
jgi:hypothetical protein